MVDVNLDAGATGGDAPTARGGGEMRLFLPIVATTSRGHRNTVDSAADSDEQLPGPEDRLASPADRWTAEVFDVPVGDDHHIIYAPLRRAAFVTTSEGRDELARVAWHHQDAGLSSRTADTIDDDGGELTAFLRELEIVDGGPEETPNDLPDGTPAPTSVTLFLTTACNLRCDYCYASAGDTEQTWMPWDVARRGIDTIINNAIADGVDQIAITYHGGGEPTLNWTVLTAAQDYIERRARQANLTLTSTLATNGVLSLAHADWIAEHLDAASVSFDGLPEVQDAHRPTVAGGGSSGPLMRTLRRFDERGFRYNIRVTVTSDQIATLPDSIDFLAANFRPNRIQVEPAYRLGRWNRAYSAETDEFVAAYREARRRARAREVELFYSAARLGLLSHHFCGVTQDTFALSPSGNVSACYEVFAESQPHADTFFYGTSSPVEDGYLLDQNRLGHLRSQATAHHDFCSGCFAKWSCAGDCYHKALTESPQSGFRGTQRCHVTRELTKDQLLTAISEAGGIRWHGGSGSG